MDKKYIIYKHTSPSGKCYIGQTCKTMEYRAGNSGNRYFDAPIFNNAIKKYGWSNFKHKVILHNLTKEEADYYERRFIKYYKELGLSYNVAAGGEGGSGVKSVETRLKISTANKGKTHSKESKQKMSESQRKRCIEKGYNVNDIPKHKLEEYKRWLRKRNPKRIKVYKGKSYPIICIETGETWITVREASRKLQCTHREIVRAIQTGIRVHKLHFERYNEFDSFWE